MAARTTTIPALVDPTNDAEDTIVKGAPYTARVIVEGTARLLMHRWSVESIEAKANAPKGSAAKKTDDIQSYVYRDDDGRMAIPGEYLRCALVAAAKYRQDPRSPRKSACDLFKAAVVASTELATLNCDTWDFIDRRRVMVQRSGITRERPGFNAGWRAAFDLLVVTPEYVNASLLRDVIVDAGRLIGLGDFRPTFGRFAITAFEVLTEGK